MSYVDDKIDRKQFIIQFITPNQYDAEVCSLVGLVRMCAPAQMVELRKRNLNYSEARARHNYLC